jgi:hypothetical protein
MSLPSVSESSNALSRALARLDKAVKAYSDAQTAYTNAQRTHEDDYDLLDQLSKKRNERFSSSFKTLCKIVRIGSETPGLRPEDLDTLIKRAAEAENTLVQTSITSGEEDAGGNERVACDNKIEDETMGGVGGLMGTIYPFYMLIIFSI